MSQFVALGMPSGATWIVIAIIGLVLFGKRLPEVGRSLGKGIVEFKAGLKGAAEELRQVDATTTATTTTPTATAPAPAQLAAAAQQPMLTTTPAASTSTVTAVTPETKPVMKFDPYTGKPLENSTTA